MLPPMFLAKSRVVLGTDCVLYSRLGDGWYEDFLRLQIEIDA